MPTRSYELPPEDLLTALGTFFVAFSELEEDLRFAVVHPFGHLADRATTLTAGVMFRPLIDRFGALYHDLPLRGHTQADVATFCSHLESLNAKRNQLAHAIWLTFDNGEVHRGSRRATPKQGLHSASEPVTAEAVLALANECDQAGTKVLEYVLAADSPPTHAALT